jgi:hypothetical protein
MTFPDLLQTNTLSEVYCTDAPVVVRQRCTQERYHRGYSCINERYQSVERYIILITLNRSSCRSSLSVRRRTGILFRPARTDQPHQSHRLRKHHSYRNEIPNIVRACLSLFIPCGLHSFFRARLDLLSVSGAHWDDCGASYSNFPHPISNPTPLFRDATRYLVVLLLV